jgi:hypothetical protein
VDAEQYAPKYSQNQKSGGIRWGGVNFQSLPSVPFTEVSMSPAQAILSGAVIIAASILLVDTVRPAAAQRGGPYQLMHHSNTAANPGVFRLDTSSGEVSFCFLNANLELACSRSVQ